MKSFFHIFTLLGAIIAGVDMLNTVSNATSAPQQAAGAAMALGWVIIPYCFARAVEQLAGR